MITEFFLTVAHLIRYILVLGFSVCLFACSDSNRDVDSFYFSNKDNTSRIQRLNDVSILPRGEYYIIELTKYGGTSFFVNRARDNGIEIFKSDSSYAQMNNIYGLKKHVIDTLIEHRLATYDSLRCMGVLGGSPYFLFYFTNNKVLFYVPDWHDLSKSCTNYLNEEKNKAIKIYDENWFLSKSKREK
jgi:hypothetical protein